MIHAMDSSFDPNLAAESAAPVRIAVTAHHGRLLLLEKLSNRSSQTYIGVLRRVANNPLLAATEI
jgi:hypothetical protein